MESKSNTHRLLDVVARLNAKVDGLDGLAVQSNGRGSRKRRAAETGSQAPSRTRTTAAAPTALAGDWYVLLKLILLCLYLGLALGLARLPRAWGVEECVE